MTPAELNAQAIGDALDRAVASALDRKRRLGQYAVMWRNGRTVRVPASELPINEADVESGQVATISQEEFGRRSGRGE